MNSTHNIYVTSSDLDKLQNLLRDARQTNYRGSTYLEMLKQELDRATVVPSKEIPHDVITMRSTALLKDVDTGEEMELTLVFPEDADPIEGKISIFAPIGTAMLGYRIGDTFTWETPDGDRTLRVERILFQPEASGDYS
jgi:regulator of nucleoside diphosphate kinase